VRAHEYEEQPLDETPSIPIRDEDEYEFVSDNQMQYDNK
jgi:hypothetical protein